MPATEEDPLQHHRVTLTGNLGAARTLVFVHGFGTDQSVWDAVAAPFATNWRIVRLDHAGGGLMDAVPFEQHRYLNLQRYAEDLCEVARALDLRDAVVVGHSVGAMIAALASRSDPARFARLVLIGASPRYLDAPGYHGGMTLADIDAIYGAATHDPAVWAKQFAATAMGNPLRPHLAAHFAEALRRVPANRVLTVLCSVLQTDYRAEMAGIRVPTLIVQAREDPIVPRGVAEFLHAQIAGSELRIIEADGHLPHVSAPAAVVEAMRGFLDAAA